MKSNKFDEMKKLYPLLSVLFLIYWGCEEEVEEDTTPPTVTITLSSNDPVSEIVSITCVSSDNEGVEKVELWVNGTSTNVIDETEPYSLDWNTTTYDNGSYVISVRSYDVNENTMDSEPITFIVDNSLSNPNPININSISLENGGFNVSWDQSSDSDFQLYNLEKSLDSNMIEYELIFSSNDISTTNFIDNDIDPLILQFYRVSVLDTFNYETKGQIYSSSLDPVPLPVNLVSVSYDLQEMVIEWEPTSDNDFFSYKVLYSDSLDGTFSPIIEITDNSVTSFSISDFDPLKENWFKIKITDIWGQSSIGNSMSNQIDTPPIQINILDISYDLNGMSIVWDQSEEFDFSYYELLFSNSEYGEKTQITTHNEISDTIYFISDFNPLVETWYWLKVYDYWGQDSVSNGYKILDQVPNSSTLDSISISNYGFLISWSENNNSDFKSYNLYESLHNDMSNSSLLFEVEDQTRTSFLKTEENFRYYQVVIEDVWGLESFSNIIPGHYNVEIWDEYYNTGTTTSLSLPSTNLSGQIPSEIGNLVNLTNLNLSDNQLTGSIPEELGNLWNLTNLDLGTNQLSGDIPSGIWNLTNLTILDLSHNDLFGYISPQIGNLVNITNLFLGNNNFSGPFPSEIVEITNLINLNLEYNFLSGNIPSEITNLNNLGVLRLNNNVLIGELPNNFCDLNLGWSNVEVFNIENNRLCPPYPVCVENYIGNQDPINCTGEVELWGEYYSIENTSSLDLSDSGLTGDIPPEIGYLINLGYLNLSNNQLTGSIPPEIGNCPLSILRLQNNQLTGSIPPEIFNYPFLSIINLSNNQLTGSIPPEIGDLSLFNLYLNDNQLSGLIPDEICNNDDYFWPSNINFNNNQLCPPYPSCIEDYMGEQDTSDCD